MILGGFRGCDGLIRWRVCESGELAPPVGGQRRDYLCIFIRCKNRSRRHLPRGARHRNRRCIKHLEADVWMCRCERAATPFGLEIAKDGLAIGFVKTRPFCLADKQSVRRIGIGCDHIDFQIFFPVSPRTRESGATPVFKHRGGVEVDQEIFLLWWIGPPEAAVRRMDAEPKTQRRILDLVARSRLRWGAIQRFLGKTARLSRMMLWISASSSALRKMKSSSMSPSRVGLPGFAPGRMPMWRGAGAAS